VARELGLHETVLRRWMMQYGTQAPAPSPSDLAAENARLRRENDHLRMERDILKKPRSCWLRRPSARSGLPMKFGFVDEHRGVWPVRMMWRVLGLSASGYYAWRVRPESRRAAANRALIEDIRLIYAESCGTYGSPRVHAVLRGQGRRVGRWPHCPATPARPTADMAIRSRPTGSPVTSRRRPRARSGSPT